MALAAPCANVSWPSQERLMESERSSRKIMQPGLLRLIDS